MRTKLILLLVFYTLSNGVHSQDDLKHQLLDIFKRIDPRSNADSLSSNAINEIFSKADLVNNLFLKNLELLKKQTPNAYKLIKEFNIKPKSFQTDSLPVSLGFEYKFENSWSKRKVNKKSLFIKNYSLAFIGNVAFNKKLNPNNFLESSFSYDGAYMWGGKPMEIDDATSAMIEEIEDSILKRRERGEQYLDLYQKVNNIIKVSDQFYVGLKGKFAFESTQDFSKKQFAPGILLNFGAKGWNNNEALRYMNILDYPFALIRLITGTDASFNVYGATFPSFLFGLDYVIPETDIERKTLIGNDKAYSRLRFEIAFKTRVARIGKEIIHFSSDFRWFKELNPDNIIKTNKLDHSSFFVAALESNNGLFVSYTSGKLPFDSQNDRVYALGFHYNLGNFK